MQKQEAVEFAWNQYFVARHECEDQGMNPDDFELQLWSELEYRLIEIERTYATL